MPTPATANQEAWRRLTVPRVRRALVWAGLAVLMMVSGWPSSPLAPASAGGQAVPPPDLPDARDPARPIRVGVVTDHYPFSYVEGAAEARGFVVDLLRAVEQTMSLRLERVEGTTAETHAAFRRGEIDLLQTYAESAERESHADFSVPYLTMAGSIFVNRNLSQLLTLDDLRGRRVVVHRGSLGEQILRRAGLGDSVSYAESVEQAFAMVDAGRGDATLASRLTGLMTIDRQALRNVVPVGQPVPGYQVRYCFAVHEGDRQLLARLNEGLAIIERTGVADDIYRQWFGPVEERRYTPLAIAMAVAAGLAVALVVAIWSLRRQRAMAVRLRDQQAQMHRAQKLEAIGTLSSGIAHDFNNILTTIIGNAELLREDVPPASVMADSASDILKAAERARHLVAQVLTFSRQHETRREVTAVMPVVEEAVRFLRATTPATIDVLVSRGGDDLRADVDVTQLHQALMNVGTNAVYTMRDRPGRLDVAVSRIPLDAAAAHRVHVRPGDYVCIAFRDTGPGIPSDVLPRIFDPFFTTKPQGEGTGLGLAVVLGIVHAHQGGVTVTSGQGVGTEVRLYLPACDRDAPAPAPSAADEAPRGDGRRVLLLDDEPGIARSVGMILERLGYAVTSSTDPAEALDRFESSPDRVDLVLTDLTMPQLDGLDVARRVRTRRPGLPVVLMSGFLSETQRQRAALSGVAATVEKPLDASVLARILDECLRSQ